MAEAERSSPTKLSTSGYARGRAGLLAALLLMAILVGAQIDPTVVCVAGIMTWIAVAWLLSAWKDKEIASSFPSSVQSRVPTAPHTEPSVHPRIGAIPNKKCPYCAEVILSEAIFCRFCGNDTRRPVPPPSTSADSNHLLDPTRSKPDGIVAALPIHRKLETANPEMILCSNCHRKQWRGNAKCPYCFVTYIDP